MDNAHQLWRTDPATLRDYIADMGQRGRESLSARFLRSRG